MNERMRNGYIAGAVLLMMAGVLAISALENNTSSSYVWFFSLFTGVCGLGSLWKPETIGHVASGALHNIGKNNRASQINHNSGRDNNTQIIIQNSKIGGINSTHSKKTRRRKYSGRSKKTRRKKSKKKR